MKNNKRLRLKKGQRQREWKAAYDARIRTAASFIVAHDRFMKTYTDDLPFIMERLQRIGSEEIAL